MDYSLAIRMLTPTQRLELQSRAEKAGKQPADLLMSLISEKQGLKNAAKDLAASASPRRFKEAEDIGSDRLRRPELRRTQSVASGLGIAVQNSTAADEMQRRSGAMWKCFGRVAGKNGGFLYSFRPRNAFNPRLTPDALTNEQTKSDEIFPAVEPGQASAHALLYTGDRARLLTELKELTGEVAAANILKAIVDPILSELDHIPDAEAAHGAFVKIQTQLLRQGLEIDIKDAFRGDINRENCRERIKAILAADFASDLSDIEINQIYQPIEREHAILLKELGYDSYIDETGDRILVFPDRNALLNSWETLRQERPELQLPPVDIYSGDGIASDMEFIEAYFTSDVLLSDSAEFVHDHSNHVMPLLTRILTAPLFSANRTEQYQNEKKRLMKLIMDAYRKIIAAERSTEEPSSRITNGDLERIKACLSMYIDGGVAAVSYPTGPEIFSPQHMDQLPQTVLGDGYLAPKYTLLHWPRRFGNAQEQLEHLKAVWARIQRQ